MSKRETPMIYRYWRRVGGTLIEEFPVVSRGKGQGPRRLDAVIIPDGEHRVASWRDVSVEGKDVIIVQAKANRLGMYLMGQALFSIDLLRRFGPSSIHSVALCKTDDVVLRPLLERLDSLEVVVDYE